MLPTHPAEQTAPVLYTSAALVRPHRCANSPVRPAVATPFSSRSWHPALRAVPHRGTSWKGSRRLPHQIQRDSAHLILPTRSRHRFGWNSRARRHSYNAFKPRQTSASVLVPPKNLLQQPAPVGRSQKFPVPLQKMRLRRLPSARLRLTFGLGAATTRFSVPENGQKGSKKCT